MIAKYMVPEAEAAGFTGFPAERIMHGALAPNGTRTWFAQTETKAPGIKAAREWYVEGHGAAYTKGVVSGTIIAAIWVALFQECQQQPCEQVLEEWRDDGSAEWDDIYQRANVRPVRVPPERPRM